MSKTALTRLAGQPIKVAGPARTPALPASPRPLIFDVQPIALEDEEQAAWDGFAARYGASFESAWGSLRYRRIAAIGRSRLRLFVVTTDIDGQQRRVAQVAWLQNGNGIDIANGVTVDPAYNEYWADIVLELLRAGGPGQYRYGCAWTVEARREEQLATLHGVLVNKVRPWLVQAVDFSRWPDWDAYWRGVRDSVRSQARHALQRVPGLALTVASGRSVERDLPEIVYPSKFSERFSTLATRLRYRAQLYFSSELYEAAIADVGGQVLASYYGCHFGSRTYCLFSSNHRKRGGASWYLLREMLQRFFYRNPQGLFLMGLLDPTVSNHYYGPQQAWRALRGSVFPVSAVDFEYRP